MGAYYWLTKDKKKILIDDMDHNHLVNSINMTIKHNQGIVMILKLDNITCDKEDINSCKTYLKHLVKLKIEGDAIRKKLNRVYTTFTLNGDMAQLYNESMDPINEYE
jgi:hypothetical protein